MKYNLYSIMVVIALVIALGLMNNCSHMRQLKDDGFTIIEEHSSYYLVKKDGHLYIATSVGSYGSHWNYEHYPNCPCKKK